MTAAQTVSSEVEVGVDPSTAFKAFTEEMFYAPVNAKDGTFEGTPLGWALYAWAGGGPHAGDSRYYNVVKLLVAAGATLAPEWLNEDERGFPIAKKIREDIAMAEALGVKL